MTKHNQTPAKPYRRAVVFAGGGLRFGYYLGVYQALCETGKRPDIVLAICGGAFAAAFLELAPEPKMALVLLQSPTAYQMFCRFYGVVPAHRMAFVLPATRRFISLKPDKSKHALSQKTLDSLYSQALFAIKDEGDYPLWQSDKLTQILSQDLTQNLAQNPAQIPTNLPSPSEQTIASLMVLSRLQTVDTGYCWQSLLRPSAAVSADVCTWLDGVPCVLHDHQPKRVAPTVAVQDLPLAVAVRASISDMYYLSPTHHDGQTLFGGVLDLTPVELASVLADEVFIDDKTPYDKLLASPAIGSCFGFDPNVRLSEVKQKTHPAMVHWLPLADSRRHVPALIGKRFHWQKGCIQGVYPTFNTFKQIAHQQYHYGYQTTKAYLLNHDNSS
ncbi:patatin-like phospholipase family protein [Moraxella sp. VT-16-12]|uniref:patatin-like phospholipase family protein n=1 Tax=Moraxella sp. VT-16-12 TaxID=2014877 RepID=UPI000B801A0B|nr:patatin-like phospholipase family protein [Moraxella sp. VT-16-12]TWV82998.1 hypothetical protein CEW93_004860 [Moraxella sp. VT-16-12]